MEAHRTTTFTPPELPRIVARPRLLARLGASPAPKVILLHGQAAQGKTTLAAAYLQNLGQSVAWIDLDPADADAANFYYLLVRAFEHAGLLRDPARFLDNPGLALGPGEGGARWRARLREACSQIDRSGVLVIDGLERIEERSASFDLLQTLLDHQPVGLLLLLLSRRESCLKFQHLAVRRQAVSITNGELAFTPEEIGAFFIQVLSMQLSTTQIQRVSAMTDGWAGGLVLLSAALEGQSLDGQHRYLEEEAPRRLSGDTLRYFSETIFAAQSEAVQTFLLRSAVLDEMTPETTSRLCRVGSAQPLLDELVRRHLFIQAFGDAGGGRVYRYNHLFHTFLRSQLTEGVAAGQVCALEDQAGDLYWERGEIEQAITHYLRGAKLAKAAAGVKKIGVDLFIRGRQADLAGWLERLPVESVKKDPWLRLLSVLSRRISGGHHNQEDLEFALGQFRREQDLRGELLSLAFLIESGVFLGTEIDKQRQCIVTAEALLAEMKGSLRYLFARTMLWFQVGIGRIVGGLDVDRGCAACRKAVLLAEQMGDPVLKLNAVVGLALGQVYRGAFGLAKETLAAVEASEHQNTYPEYGILNRLVRVELAIHHGSQEAAARDLERVQDEIESFGLLFLYPVYLDLCGWLAISRRDAPGALQHGHQLGDLAALAANPFYEGLALRMMALANYHLAHINLAHRQATEAVRCFETTSFLELHRAHANLLLALTARRRGDAPGARGTLTNLLAELWLERGQPRLLAEIHLALALVHQELGKTDAIPTHLQAAQRLLGDRAGSFLFLTDHDVRDLDHLHQVGDGGAQGRPSADAASSETTPAAPEFSPSDPIPDAVDARGRSTTLLEIRAFGGLRVDWGPQGAIADRQWGGRLPKLLLEAIIVHGLRDIPKEVIIESLWPEADPAASAGNFKVTLHRLRKVLQPNLGRGERSAYVHLRDGRISLDPDHCRVDVQQFLEAAKKIRNGGARLDSQALRALCRRARALYTGDFLPEERYAPWAEMKRLALRDTYQYLLSTEARILMEEGALAAAADLYAELLRLEPCLEAAAQNLMRLYARLGRRGDALQVFAAFTDILHEALGVRPDLQTQDLFEQIHSGHPV